LKTNFGFIQTGNQVSWKPVENKPRIDIMGLVMNFIGPALLVIPSISFLLVFIDIDCAYHVIPLHLGRSILGLTLRSFVTLLTLTEMATTIGVVHLILMTLIMHTKSIYTHLELYKSSKWKQNVPNVAMKKLRQVAKNINKDPSVFDGYSDITIFKLSAYFFTVARKNLDFSVVFILFPGFALEVFFNFTILTCFDKLPFLIYIFVILICIIIPVIIVTELPQAGKGYEASESLIHFWKSGCYNRRSDRFKNINSCKPVGYSLGGMFIFRVSTTTTFFEALMDYTINAILSF